MIKVFDGQTADEVWRLAVSSFHQGENVKEQSGRGGSTQEILHAAFTIQDPRQRWIVTRHPALNPAFAIAEVIWILSGRKDANFLNYWNSQLPKYAGSGKEYHGAYGFRLRSHFGIDQLERAYQALRHNPDGRQVVLQIWDPAIDFPNENGQPVNADIPCNISSFLKIRDGRLEWMQTMRSNDLFLGVPYNFIQFTSLQEVLAGWLGVELGSYNHLSDSLHLYHRDTERFNVHFPSYVAQNTDSLSLPKEDSDAVKKKINKFVDAMRENLSQEDLQSLVAQLDIPVAFQNLLRIVAAEAARKRGWTGLAQTIASSCSNPMLIQAWERWFLRFQQPT